MQRFPIHTLDTAPAGSRPTFETVQAAMGQVPNLAAGMAAAPTLMRGFFTLRQIYSEGTLSPAEVQVLSLANAVENDCAWCVAFHSRLAGASGVPKDVIRALRDGESPDDRRLAALAGLTRDILRNRGKVSAEAIDRFYAEGFEPAQALEVVLGVGFSVLANYANAIIQAPLDESLAPFAWEGAAAVR